MPSGRKLLNCVKKSVACAAVEDRDSMARREVIGRPAISDLAVPVVGDLVMKRAVLLPVIGVTDLRHAAKGSVPTDVVPVGQEIAALDVLQAVNEGVRKAVAVRRREIVRQVVLAEKGGPVIVLDDRPTTTLARRSPRPISEIGMHPGVADAGF